MRKLTHAKFGKVTVTNETETMITFIIDATNEEKTLLTKYAAFIDESIEVEVREKVIKEKEEVIISVEAQNFFEVQRANQMRLLY